MKAKESFFGKEIDVVVDRMMGTAHPNYPQNIYPINYGYVDGILAPDGDFQDVYILGEDKPVTTFHGKIIAIVKRDNDVEEKWVAAPNGKTFSREQIAEKIDFMERYHKSHICMNEEEYENQKQKGNE